MPCPARCCAVPATSRARRNGEGVMVLNSVFWCPPWRWRWRRRSPPRRRPGPAALSSAPMNMPSAMAAAPTSVARRGNRARRGLPAWQRHPFRRRPEDLESAGAPEVAFHRHGPEDFRPAGAGQCARAQPDALLHLGPGAFLSRLPEQDRDLCESVCRGRSRPAAGFQPHRRRLQPGRQDQGQSISSAPMARRASTTTCTGPGAAMRPGAATAMPLWICAPTTRCRTAFTPWSSASRATRTR